MKRAAVALIASASLGLVGCGGNDDEAPAGPTTVRVTEFGQIDGVVEADGNTVSWRGVNEDGRTLPAGMYWLRLTGSTPSAARSGALRVVLLP